MSKRNMLGVVLCTAIFIGGFWMSGGLALYWNLAACLIVVAGLCAALFMSYPFERIKKTRGCIHTSHIKVHVAV